MKITRLLMKGKFQKCYSIEQKTRMMDTQKINGTTTTKYNGYITN
jgi:hypothetical protein